MVNLIVLGISLHSNTHTPLLLLYPMGTERILCLRIDPMEGFAVSKALHGFGAGSEQAERMLFADTLEDEDSGDLSREERMLRRPMVHDLLLETLTALGGKLLSVTLSGEQAGFYFAEAAIAGPRGIMRLNCRPADGVALALRAKAPVRIVDSLMSHAENLSDVMDSLPEHIQVLARATMLAAEAPGARVNEENTLPSSNGDKPAGKVSDMKKIVIHMEGGKMNQVHGQVSSVTLHVGTGDPDRKKGSSLGPLPDGEDWTDLLSSLTPETKEPM